MPLPLPLRWLPLLALAACARAARQPIDFNRDIRPILSENCFACHGPDAKQAQGRAAARPRRRRRRSPHERRTRDRAGRARRERADRAAIATDDADELMPPPKSARSSRRRRSHCSAVDRAGAAVRRALGVRRRRCARAARGRATPAGRATRSTASSSPGSKPKGCSPSPEADRATLLRRVTLDLTGLPPTPAEVDAFVADRSRPTPTRRSVDRLLASPRYGERMALDWLDAARYADTHGYHIDNGRDMWPWRDWVIGAFNAQQAVRPVHRRAARRRPAARRRRSSRRSPPASTATT